MQYQTFPGQWRRLANSYIQHVPCVFGAERRSRCNHKSYEECKITGGQAAIALYFAQRICASEWMATLMPLTTLRSVRTHTLMRCFMLKAPPVPKATDAAVAKGVVLVHSIIDPKITITEYDMLADLFFFTKTEDEHARLLAAVCGFLGLYAPKTVFLRNLHTEMFIGTLTTLDLIQAVETFTDSHYPVKQAADIPHA